MIYFKKNKMRSALLITSIIIAITALLALSICIIAKNRCAAFAPRFKAEIVKHFNFSDSNPLNGWEEKIFKDKVKYTIEKDESISYVRAISDNADSALYYQIKLDTNNRRPIISWRWRVEKFPTKSGQESLEIMEQDDFAARFYVIFPTFFILNSKVLEYVWAEKVAVGTIGTSPYSKNIKLMVLRSGPPKEKEWEFEERDIEADYMKVFGGAPERDIGAIAIMTNSEHTGTSADAKFGDIKLGYKEEGKAK